MSDRTNILSLRVAALIAGLAILTMSIAAPFAELFVYPKLVVPGDAAVTAKNIMGHQGLFIAGILGYLVTFVCDVVAAWALYVFLRPSHEDLSLLAAWFRVVYAVIAVVALFNLVTVFQLLTTPAYSKVFEPDRLYAQVRLALGAFRNGWTVGLIFFGVHLVLLGALAIRSGYIPVVLGVLLVIGGMGYLITSVGPFVLPGVNLHVARFTFYGELFFMLWLIVRGSRIREQVALRHPRS